MKILVSTPTYGNILDSRMVSSFLKLLTECKEKNISLEWDRPNSPMLAYNRNASAHKAQVDQADWLLFWDSDTVIPDPGFLLGMIDTAYKNGADVVGLPCRLKVEDTVYNYAMKTAGKYINGKSLPKEPFFVDVIGTGVMLIRVAKLTELEHPYFTFIDTFSDKPGFFPEDWTFCEQVQKKHGLVFCDPRFEVIHYGSYGFK